MTISELWVLIDSQGRGLTTPLQGSSGQGIATPDGDIGKPCLLLFKSSAAAEWLRDSALGEGPLGVALSLTILLPHRLGENWRSSLQAVLRDGVEWAVGLGIRNGEIIYGPHVRIHDLLDGDLPHGLER